MKRERTHEAVRLVEYELRGPKTCGLRIWLIYEGRADLDTYCNARFVSTMKYSELILFALLSLQFFQSLLREFIIQDIFDIIQECHYFYELGAIDVIAFHPIEQNREPAPLIGLPFQHRLIFRCRSHFLS